MRPKDTYSKEEYNQVKQQLLIMTDKYQRTKQELDNANNYIKYLQSYYGGRGNREIQRLMSEENSKIKFNEMFVKYPYYKKVKSYVESGVTEVMQLVQLTGKSRSAIYRALHDMGLFPLKNTTERSNSRG